MRYPQHFSLRISPQDALTFVETDGPIAHGELPSETRPRAVVGARQSWSGHGRKSCNTVDLNQPGGCVRPEYAHWLISAGEVFDLSSAVRPFSDPDDYSAATRAKVEATITALQPFAAN
jgi:hypothetical protein